MKLRSAITSIAAFLVVGVAAFAGVKDIKLGDKVDFSVKDEKGKTVKLSKYKGKVKVLVFYASWCGPCNLEAPHVEKSVWKKFKSRGVQVLGMAIQEGDPSKKIPLFRKKHHVTYPLLSDESGEVASMFGFKSIPTIIILDKQGRYRAKDPDNINKTITALLK